MTRSARITRWTLTALVLTVLMPAGVRNQSPGAAVDPAQVDRVFARWQSQAGPGCAVGVGQGGRPVLTRAYGMADLEHEVANTPTTIFEAGSVSKQFTAAAVVLLAHGGKLSLDDDVRRHVPELPDYGATITIRHMMSHVSGLRDWGTVLEAAGWPRGTRAHTHAHVLDIVSRQKAINFPPGSEYLYSNTGYNLLAMIVERASGESFADFTRRHIFEPLGMRRTSWRDDYTRVVKGRAIAYAPRPDGGFRTQMPFENVHGNGGLLTTVGDLLLWNENFVHGRVGGRALTEELQRQAVLTSGRTIPYAEGLVVGEYRGVRQVSHSGSTAGYRAYLARYPDRHISVAVLCNVASGNATQFAHQVADLYLGTGPRSSSATRRAQVSEDAMAPRLGLYRNRRTHEAVRLAVADGRLRMEPGPTLTPVEGAVFEVAADGTQVTLAWDADGAVDVLRVTTDEGEVREFERVADAAPSPGELAAYAGEYHSDEAEVTYRVAVVDGALVLTRRPQVSYPLTPTYRDAFRAGNGWLVRFIRDDTGRVEAMSLGLGRVRDLRFPRAPDQPRPGTP